MGFGYLFIGYLFFFNLSFAGFTDVIAVTLMLIGLSTLRQYARGFRAAFYSALPLLLLTLCSFVFEMLKLLSLSTPIELSLFVTILSHAAKCVLLWNCLTGVAQLSHETEIPVLQARALRNRLLTPVCFLLAILLECDVLPLPVYRYVAVAYLVYALVYTFMNARAFFESYVWICLEGEESMEGNASRFGFINRLNALSAKMDEKTLQRKRQENAEKAERKRQREEKKRKK